MRAKRTIFIVCEGAGTEPSYFSSIRDLILDKGLDISITISPMPKDEQDAKKVLRVGAKKRELRKIKEEDEEKLKKYEIEKIYRAQPVRYVRDAQMRLEDGSYDEVWAVFDKNGHPHHPEAFALAAKKVNGKTVNIAFSSIAFEYWILLHFVQLYHTFVKSQCRQEDRPIACGTGRPPTDCHGVRCIYGYLKEHRYIPNYEKSMSDLFHILAPHLSAAFVNAVWLRNARPVAQRASPLYDQNPYLDIDRLVFKLLHLPNEFTWFERTMQIDHIVFNIHRNENIVRISIINTSPGVPFILNSGAFKLSDATDKHHPVNGRQTLRDAVEPAIEFDLNTLPDFLPIYIIYNKVESEYYIMDL